METQPYVTLPTSNLVENPLNRRVISRENYQLLLDKLEKKRQYKPLLVTPNDDGTHTVLAGNHRLKAYRELGAGELWVSVLEFTLSDDGLWRVIKDGVMEMESFQTKDDAMLDWALTDNEEFAENDWDAFVNDMNGYNLDWSRYLMSTAPQKTITNALKDFLMENEPEVTEDEVPEVSQEPAKSELGKVYQLGRHRLMCGDATKIEDVEKLMNGQKADISFTSPPYNAGKTPTETKMGIEAKYENDSDDKSNDEYLSLLTNSTLLSLSHSAFSFVNIQSISGNKTPLIEFLYQMKEKYADTLIWDKLQSQPAMAENVLNSEFEYVHVFSDKATRAIGTRQFRGTLKNIVHIGKQNANDVENHHATFPMEFVGHFVANFCNDGGVVLDVFGGAGTTLIACEQLNRACYMMELDPKYCDVIRKRYHKFTHDNNEDGWEESTPEAQQQQS